MSPWNLPAQRNANLELLKAIALALSNIRASAGCDGESGAASPYLGTVILTRSKSIGGKNCSVGIDGGFYFYDSESFQTYIVADYLYGLKKTKYSKESTIYMNSVYNTFDQVIGDNFVFNRDTFTVTIVK